MLDAKREPSITQVTETLGDRIRWVREILEINQVEFAEMLRVKQATISHWETDKHTPRWPKLREIAAKLRVTASYLDCGDLYGVEAPLAARLKLHHPELASRSAGRT